MTPQEKQQLKARFFGMHIGCKVLADNGISENSGAYVELKGGVYCECKFSENLRVAIPSSSCKLILRPLSDIKKTEAKHLTTVRGETHYEWGFYYQWFIRNKHANPSLMKWILSNAAVVDYLRSLNFSLPFNGLDPIAEGWAILEEEIPANAPQNQKEEEI